MELGDPVPSRDDDATRSDLEAAGWAVGERVGLRSILDLCDPALLEELCCHFAWRALPLWSALFPGDDVLERALRTKLAWLREAVETRELAQARRELPAARRRARERGWASRGADAQRAAEAAHVATRIPSPSAPARRLCEEVRYLVAREHLDDLAPTRAPRSGMVAALRDIAVARMIARGPREAPVAPRAVPEEGGEAATVATLRAMIVAAPDDDAPRLAYGDWLAERGDPRGDFINAQCVLEQASPGDPAYPALRAREGRLLARHHEAWSEELRETGRARGVDLEEDLQPLAFRRGLLADVRAGAFLMGEDGEALFDAYPLERASLQRQSETLLHAISPALYPRLIDVPCHLEYAFSRLPDGLLGAQLFDLRVTLDTLEQAIGVLGTGLRELSLVGGRFEGAALNAWADEAPLADVEALTLWSTRLNRAAVAALFDDLARWPALRTLRLRGQAISGPAGFARRLPVWDGAARLRALEVGFRVKPLLALLGGAWPALERLDLRKAEGGEPLARALAAASLPSLHALDLSQAGFGPSIPVLAPAPWLRQLGRLELGKNGLDDAALAPLLDAGLLTRLNRLGLDSNKLSDHSCCRLAEDPAARHLWSLSLSNNRRIGEAGARALLDSPHLDLAHLDLPTHKLSRATLNELGERIPVFTRA